MRKNNRVLQMTFPRVRSSVSDGIYYIELYYDIIISHSSAYVAKGETDEELWKNGTEHLIKAHGMKAEDITSQFKHHYKQYIKDH